MAQRGKIEGVTELVEETMRPIRSKKYVYFILIVCEDEKTEPVYFKHFEELFEDLLPEETVYVRRVGTGRNSLGVVKAAINERQIIYDENNHRDIDETWVVFDKDDLDKTPGNIENFKSAFQLAQDETIHVAYSNECFEIWLLLHFKDVDPRLPIPRNTLYSMLEKAVNTLLPKDNPRFVYHHGDTAILKHVFSLGDERMAMTRAQTLRDFHESENHIPIDSNPVTLVDILVRSLRDWFRYYSYE